MKAIFENFEAFYLELLQQWFVLEFFKFFLFFNFFFFILSKNVFLLRIVVFKKDKEGLYTHTFQIV